MIVIDDVKIGQDQPPYIIAELSANHGGSIEAAKLSIKLAKESGASAVKIQSYTADTMTIDSQKPDFLITDGLWNGYTLYDLYSEAHTPFEWHQELFRYASEQGVTLFSSPFALLSFDYFLLLYFHLSFQLKTRSHPLLLLLTIRLSSLSTLKVCNSLNINKLSILPAPHPKPKTLHSVDFLTFQNKDGSRFQQMISFLRN